MGVAPVPDELGLSASAMHEPSFFPRVEGAPTLRSIVLIGTSFKTSSINFRERIVGLLGSDPSRFFRSLPHVLEFVLLVTCNRVEVFLATEDPEQAAASFFLEMEKGTKDTKQAFYIKKDFDAIVHIFRLASGLDSLVVGEEQILEQIRAAGTSARILGNSKSILSTLFDVATSVGKRIRSSYETPSSNRSVSSFALRFALEKLGREPRKVLLIGTGKIARLAATELKGARIHIVTRRKDISGRFPGAVVISHGSLKRAAKECDLVLSATKHAGYVIKRGDLPDDRPVVLLDLAFPRNIDPRLKHSRFIQLYDLDDLAKHAKETFHDPALTSRGDRLIREEAGRFARLLTASKLSPTISAIYRWADDVRTSETEMALRRLSSLSDREKRVVQAMSRRLVSKLLGPPTAFAKGSSDELTQEERLHLLERIFVEEAKQG